MSSIIKKYAGLGIGLTLLLGGMKGGYEIAKYTSTPRQLESQTKKPQNITIIEISSKHNNNRYKENRESNIYSPNIKYTLTTQNKHTFYKNSIQKSNYSLRINNSKNIEYKNEYTEIEKIYKNIKEMKNIKAKYPYITETLLNYIKIRKYIDETEKELYLPKHILRDIFYVESRYKWQKSNKDAIGIAQITKRAYEDVITKYKEWKRQLKHILDQESYKKVINGEVLKYKDTRKLNLKVHPKSKIDEVWFKEVMSLYVSRIENLLRKEHIKRLPNWHEVETSYRYNIIAGGGFYLLKYLENINKQAIKVGDKIKFILRSYKHFNRYGSKYRFFDPYTIYLLYNSTPKKMYDIIKNRMPSCKIQWVGTKKGILYEETVKGLINLKYAIGITKELEKMYLLHKKLIGETINEESHIQKHKEYETINKIREIYNSIVKNNKIRIKHIKLTMERRKLNKQKG